MEWGMFFEGKHFTGHVLHAIYLPSKILIRFKNNWLK